MLATNTMKLKAKYRTVGPKKVKQAYTHCWMDKETNSLQQEVRTHEIDMYMVYFPQGHSIRVTLDELKRLGFHLKPRMVDMATGDVVDLGGDPYDFAEEDNDDETGHAADGDDIIVGSTKNKGK